LFTKNKNYGFKTKNLKL